MAKRISEITLTDFAQITDAIDWTLHNFLSNGASVQAIRNLIGDFEQGSLNNGVAESSTTRIRSADYIKVSPNTQYTINVTGANFVVVQGFDANKVFKTKMAWQELPYTFTTASDVAYIKVVLKKDDTTNITPSSISNASLTTPNLTDINSVVNPMFTVEGKNLLDVSATTEIEKINVTYAKSDKVVLTNTSTSATGWRHLALKIANSLPVGKLVKWSGIIEKSNAAWTPLASLVFKNSSGTTIKRVELDGEPFEVPEHAEARLLLYMNSTTAYPSGAAVNDTVTYSSLMPEVVNSITDTATEYQEYKAQSVTVEGVFASLNNGTKDTIVFKDTDGLWKSVNRLKTLELDGTELWSLYASGPSYTFSFNTVNSAFGYQKSLCSHFKNVNGVWVAGKRGEYGDHTSTARKYFVSDKATVADWTAWLASEKTSGRPVTLVYTLAEPITTVLPQATQDALNSLQTYKTQTNVSVVSDTGVLGETTIEYITRLAEHGLKLGGEELTQGKLNGKYLWAGKHNGDIVWWNKYYPGDIVFEENPDIPNLLQNNTNVLSSTKTWECIPFETETPNGVWSIVSQSGFPATLEINSETGKLTCVSPSSVNNGGTCKFKLRYKVETRHGVIQKDTPEITIQRIVAPYFSVNNLPSVLTIDTAISKADIVSVGGTVPESNLPDEFVLTGNPGLIVSAYYYVGGGGGIAIMGTPTYVDDDWGLTNGLALQQSISLENEAGKFTISWYVERRLNWSSMVANKSYNVKSGAKMGTINSGTLTLIKHGTFPFLSYGTYSFGRARTNDPSYTSTYYGAVGAVGLSRKKDLPFVENSHFGNWTRVTGVNSSFQETVFSDIMTDNKSGTTNNYTLYVGGAVFNANYTLIKPSNVSTDYRALNNNLYITG